MRPVYYLPQQKDSPTEVYNKARGGYFYKGQDNAIDK